MNTIGKNLDKRRPPKMADHIAQDMSLKEIIITLAPKLISMKRRGFATDEIAAVLLESKISIDGKTLNRYLNEFKAIEKGEVPGATAKPKRAKATDGKDGFTPGEEMPSEQPNQEIATEAAPSEDCLTPDGNTPSEQPSRPVSTMADSLPAQLRDLI